ncbi:hypothetical protein EGW08_010065 [Elysia chlorotica]|uniref:Uncharacterized protein n=1 Tax=Elysia chlorotica TaxID=188477 RepID=A0A3S1BJB9_ELYCH|nr:hypothetical protein EGW08_010065 [Elysia chlorotica]
MAKALPGFRKDNEDPVKSAGHIPPVRLDVTCTPRLWPRFRAGSSVRQRSLVRSPFGCFTSTGKRLKSQEIFTLGRLDRHVTQTTMAPAWTPALALGMLVLLAVPASQAFAVYGSRSSRVPLSSRLGYRSRLSNMGYRSRLSNMGYRRDRNFRNRGLGNRYYNSNRFDRNNRFFDDNRFFYNDNQHVGRSTLGFGRSSGYDNYGYL